MADFVSSKAEQGGYRIMKLSILNGQLFGEDFRKHFKRVAPLLSVMPKRKQRHSRRVGKRLHRLGLGKGGTYAGLLHDYLERGGDEETLRQHVQDLGLPPNVVNIVLALTGADKEIPDPDDSPENPSLEHLTHSIPQLDPDLKNLTILVKLSDRLDNLKKRLRQKGRVSPQYQRKSRDIVNFLASHYTGKPKHFRKLQAKIEATMG